MKRYLHLHSSFGTGGKELRCVQLMNAFGGEAAHTIISGVPGAMEAARLIAPQVAVEYPADFPPLSGRPSPARLKALASAMRGFDLVLTYNWGAMDAVLAHRFYSRALALPPLIHHEDGFNEDERERLKPSRNLFRRMALPGASALMVPSRTLDAIARDVWRQPPAKVRYIPNGIDTAPFLAEPRADALPGLLKQPGEQWVGTLAGLRKVKDLPLLVRAFAQLPESWRLVLVGEGPEKDSIAEVARECGVADRVHLPGFVANPAGYVGLFDIFALSSKSEQFPISVVEAMAAGKPIIAPDVGDVRAMVSDENRPLIGLREGLAAQLCALAQDTASQHHLGEANRRKALAEYDEAPMIAAHKALHDEAIARGKAG